MKELLAVLIFISCILIGISLNLNISDNNVIIIIEKEINILGGK